MPRFLDRLSDLLVGNGYLLAVALGSLLLLFAAASFALLRFTGGRRAKHVPVTSINDEETIHRIVRKLHLTMRQAGEQGLDEETIFNPAIYEQMKADSKDLDRLLPNILINLYSNCKPFANYFCISCKCHNL